MYYTLNGPTPHPGIAVCTGLYKKLACMFLNRDLSFNRSYMETTLNSLDGNVDHLLYGNDEENIWA